MPTSPGPLLAALDALWERLRADVAELPRIRSTVSPTKRRKDHGPERWTVDADGSVSGFVVSADVLQEGPEAVLEMVLHDAAHLLNWVRGVNDTTMRGAYHNQEFLTAADEVGLQWSETAQRTQSRGSENVTLTNPALRRHRPDLAALSDTIPLLLPHLELPSTVRADRVDRLTLRCKCTPARTFRISQTIAAKGPIVCGVCGNLFDEE
ncbi:hypothetical protein M2271_003551 [Streptomyces sp. LBL]|uniref:hypothetical protein n=1 Tax=Streptomyces sp. LBL TaxID=2940562 RepID=UPI002473C080|nr:hypothetical protein [Streptomyces sp. LBL]MDH6625740.1 hypothetical protein [Streptomyces sp. LBL]